MVLVNAGSGLGFGENTDPINGVAARALEVDHDGDAGHWSRKALFLSLVVSPFAFLLGIVWAWVHRAAIRAKSGAFGRFNLWFPLFTTLAAVIAVFAGVPRVSGVPQKALRRYQPDFVPPLVAIAVTGPTGPSSGSASPTRVAR